MLGKITGARQREGKTEILLALTNTTGLDDLDGATEYEITIKKPGRKRTLTANAYMWALIHEIAIAIQSTDLEVYRHALRNAGCPVYLDVKKEAVKDTIQLLTNIKPGGTGDFAELWMQGNSPDRQTVVYYAGSSKYTKEQFSRLLDFVIDEAKALSISTMNPDEVERLKDEINN